ncbi:hypothetical protein TrCOL_g4485 [Triparma columacea]|uniref:Pseudouridine synthase RsuA/RluA-like domain-containing protein n=1 Tax=Triparma columacea TaxID=722753 RepID=A0A9W7L1M9_9STRA|nr:hypothetical protein TrCOL_g4485 [Triparma columacea]
MLALFTLGVISLLTLLTTSSIYSLSPTYALNKPYGVLSQFVSNKTNKSQALLCDLPSVSSLPEPLMAVGRLDKDTEGLLLLTSRGEFSRRVTYGVGPERVRVEKEYFCLVDGIVDDSALERLREGVEIGGGEGGGGYVTKRANVRRVGCDEAVERVGSREGYGAKSIRAARHGPTSWISLAIKEGRNRQVRRMTAAVGFPTLRLVRVRVGGVELRGLVSGGVIEVKEEDVFEGINVDV